MHDSWKRRFRAPFIAPPTWARDNPNRIIYGSNAEGAWEIYAWDIDTDAHRRVTSRPEGTRVGRIDARGTSIWWFDDDRGNDR